MHFPPHTPFGQTGRESTISIRNSSRIGAKNVKRSFCNKNGAYATLFGFHATREAPPQNPIFHTCYSHFMLIKNERLFAPVCRRETSEMAHSTCKNVLCLCISDNCTTFAVPFGGLLQDSVATTGRWSHDKRSFFMHQSKR